MANEEFVITRPPEYECLYREGRGQSGVQKAIREFQSNAQNYGATNSGAFVGHTKIDGKYADFLWFHHNGKGWKDINQTKKAMVPLASEQRNGAFQGLGLGAAAFLNCSLAEVPVLVVGGWIDNKFVFVKVYPIAPNRLVIEEAPEMVDEYTRLVGAKLLRSKKNGEREFNVVYGVKLQPLSLDSSGVPISPIQREIPSSLQFLAPSLFNGSPVFHYSSPVIGFPYPKPDMRKRNASLESCEWGRNSSTYRRLYPHDEYMSRFLVRSFVTPSQPFEYSPEEDVICTVDAEVKLGYYQNVQKRKTNATNFVGYSCNLRELSELPKEEAIDGQWGAGPEGGDPPDIRAVMTMTLLYTEAQQKYPTDAHAYLRFLDNAVMTHQSMHLLAGYLGLNPPLLDWNPAVDLSKFDPTLKSLAGEVKLSSGKYIFRQKPFMTIEISIKGIRNCRRISTGEKINYLPESFVSKFHRTGDFWLANDQRARDLMVMVLENTAPNMRGMHPEAYELSNLLHPIDTSSRCKIHLGNNKMESSKRRAGSREAKCHIYQLDGDNNYGKVEIKPGGRQTVVIKDESTKRLMRASELNLFSSCRGIEFIDSTNNLDILGENVIDRLNELSAMLEIPVNNIPVITIAVERTKHLGKVIPKDEWEPNNSEFSPSRNIVAIWNDGGNAKRLNIGIVADLPPAETDRKDPPDPGPGDPAKKGKRRSVPTTGGETGEFDPTCERHESIRFWFDANQKRIKINVKSAWGKRYWDCPCAANSTLDKHLNQIWNDLQGVALSLFGAIRQGAMKPENPRNFPERFHDDARLHGHAFDEGNEPWDYPINEVLDEIIGERSDNSQSEICKLLERIDKLLEKQSDLQDK